MLARTPIVVALVGAAALAAQAQRRGLDVQDVGLPAMNVGLVTDASHAPGTPHTRANAIVAAAIRNDGRVRSSGSAATSHVIVRFREEASPDARAAAVRAAVSGGAIMERPSYADFDLVRIGDA